MRSFASPRQQRLVQVPQRAQPGYVSYEDLRDVEQSMPYMSPMTDPARYMMNPQTSRSKLQVMAHSPSKEQYMMSYDTPSRGYETVSPHFPLFPPTCCVKD